MKQQTKGVCDAVSPASKRGAAGASRGAQQYVSGGQQCMASQTRGWRRKRLLQMVYSVFQRSSVSGAAWMPVEAWSKQHYGSTAKSSNSNQSSMFGNPEPMQLSQDNSSFRLHLQHAYLPWRLSQVDRAYPLLGGVQQCPCSSSEVFSPATHSCVSVVFC
jgi:hypothetical protein